jgi:hypothetical protein
MKKILNALLILASFIGYLEWSGGNSGFLLQMELDIFKKASESLSSVAHPFVVLPLFGQLILLFTLFQKEPGKKITMVGAALLGLIMLMFLLIGILGANFKMIFAALPYMVIAFFVMKAHKKTTT